jgi:hypothetical protein
MMTMMTIPPLLAAVVLASLNFGTKAYSILPGFAKRSSRTLSPEMFVATGRRTTTRRGGSWSSFSLASTASSSTPTTTTTTTTNEYSFIDTELRGAAMKLHTREQAPREGEATSAPAAEPYVPTRDDYLAFLVDSHHVYAVLEDLCNSHDELVALRQTGLERTDALANDITYLCAAYGLNRPEVGMPGRNYAQLLQTLPIPALVCHYYNHYFAHTAGGRMIGKKMSQLLLDGTTLHFYKVRFIISARQCFFGMNCEKKREREREREMFIAWVVACMCGRTKFFGRPTDC